MLQFCGIKISKLSFVIMCCVNIALLYIATIGIIAMWTNNVFVNIACMLYMGLLYVGMQIMAYLSFKN